MNAETLLNRIDSLLSKQVQPNDPLHSQATQERVHGVITLLNTLYGANSPQLAQFQKDIESIRSRYRPDGAASFTDPLARGTLQSLREEIKAGLIGNLQRVISGEVLSDFLQLSREALGMARK